MDQSACWELGCAACALCNSQELGRRAREVEEEGGGREGGRGGGCQSRPCGKTPQEEEEDTQQAAREQY